MDFKDFVDKYQKVPVEESPNSVLDNIPQPMVSCRVSTYMHAPYIKQCLDGILMQKTNFPYEIVIGEDESSDGTREICIEYAKKHSDKIRLFLHKRENNILREGQPTAKFQGTYTKHKCRGKYEAICEGDDYWIDPLKLQKQIDFLEANPDYGMVHTDLHEYNTVKKTWRKNIWKNTNYFQSGNIFNSLLIGRTSMIYACTAVVRKDLLTDYLDDLPKMNLAMGDTFVWLVISAQSMVGYFSEPTAVRQLLPSSATQGIDCKKRKAFLDSGNKLLNYANSKFNVDPEILRIANESKSLRYLELYHSCDDKNLFRKEEIGLGNKGIIIEKYLYKLKTKNRYFNYLLRKIVVLLRKNNLDYASKVYKILDKND